MTEIHALIRQHSVAETAKDLRRARQQGYKIISKPAREAGISFVSADPHMDAASHYTRSSSTFPMARRLERNQSRSVRKKA